ncbi:hypothetical protein [Streptomyces sp. NPDC056707]|uniref:hypothetical protein n=1 Tax=Streptomyces sp. NPDC056707 TaxID=3345919 RepID=UPI003686B854
MPLFTTVIRSAAGTGYGVAAEEFAQMRLEGRQVADDEHVCALAELGRSAPRR